MNNQNGKSLVEIVLVLAAIGVFAAILLPALATVRATSPEHGTANAPTRFSSASMNAINPALAGS